MIRIKAGVEANEGIYRDGYAHVLASKSYSEFVINLRLIAERVDQVEHLVLGILGRKKDQTPTWT